MRRLAVLFVLLVVCSAVLPGVVAAQRTGGSVVVEEGETVNGFTAYAGTVVVRGTVQGDLEAYAGTVIIEEGATVTGRLRVYGGTVRVEGTVGSNALAYAGSVVVTESADIRGTLGAAAGSVVLAGIVRGDATIGAGSITLAPTARVTGDLIYDGTLDDRGGTVQGEIQRSSDLALGPTVGGPLGIALAVYLLLADLALGVVLLVAFPRYTWSAANTIGSEPLQSLGVGLLAVVAVPVALALVAVTVVGIPLALAGLALFVVGLWIASVLGRLGVGWWLLSFTEVDNRFTALLVGVVLVALLARIPVVGEVLRAVVTLLGAGVLALGLYDAFRRLRNRSTGGGWSDDRGGGRDDGPPEL